MAEYHVGCGLAGIYAGTLKKNGYEWMNKSLVTREALDSVAQYLLTNKKCVIFEYKGTKYRMEPVPEPPKGEANDL